ncbi:hypothetical protein R8Z50_14835 [Longispora sp. K20-0274]|uniref:hypothetical protein n=1 Tax=Longispora sp. K20-0274 TaxID=3088255 RepID=UPI00399A3F26
MRLRVRLRWLDFRQATHRSRRFDEPHVRRPAQALPNNCWGPDYRIGYGAGTIDAEGVKYCPSIGEYLAAYTSIQRQDPATGTWTIVAGHLGEVTYTCVGSATNTYRVGGTSAAQGWYPFTAPCG